MAVRHFNSLSQSSPASIAAQSASKFSLKDAGSFGIAVGDIFSTDLYTGNGSSQTIVNGIDLASKGGIVWVKQRDNANNHNLHTTDLGVTGSASLRTNTTGGAFGDGTQISSFNGNGFTLGSYSEGNLSGWAFNAWTFRKAPGFFDVVEYTGTGSVTPPSIPHTLGAVPGMVIIKSVSHSDNWHVYHRGHTLQPNEGLALNLTGGGTSTYRCLQSHPTDANFLPFQLTTNVSGRDYIAYLFAHNAEVDGLIQCGGYVGNGSSTGPLINLGWEPQWVMIRVANPGGDWWIYDNARDTANPRTVKLRANSSAAEDTSGEDIDFLASGFQPKTTAAGINASGDTYTYTAIRAEGA